MQSPVNGDSRWIAEICSGGYQQTNFIIGTFYFSEVFGNAII
jgi:hypothetical protein